MKNLRIIVVHIFCLTDWTVYSWKLNNVPLPQDLDQRVYDLMKEVDECYSTYIEGVGSMETKDKARYII